MSKTQFFPVSIVKLYLHLTNLLYTVDEINRFPVSIVKLYLHINLLYTMHETNRYWSDQFHLQCFTGFWLRLRKFYLFMCFEIGHQLCCNSKKSKYYNFLAKSLNETVTAVFFLIFKFLKRLSMMLLLNYNVTKAGCKVKKIGHLVYPKFSSKFWKRFL